MSLTPRAAKDVVRDERSLKRRHGALVGNRADGDEEGLGFARAGLGDDVMNVGSLAFDAVVRVHVERVRHARDGGRIAHDSGGEDEVVVPEGGAVAEDDLLALHVERRHVGV